MIKIYSFKNTKEAGKSAADLVASAIKSSNAPTLGLATGSSPLDLYAALIEKYESGELSFKNVKTINLDEYVGLTPDHDQSYAYFMYHNLFSHIDIDPQNTNLPSGINPDPEAECKRYDALVESFGGVDVQVIGIGNNGHIAFNEPSDHFTKGTNLVSLTESTISANSRFFASVDDVPTKAISMGIGQILSAKTILLVANGKGKAQILERALFGEVTPAVPASILQFAKNVEVFLDEEAASVIRELHPEAIFN
jgi:glucosamine-6-phosphate deaminase